MVNIQKKKKIDSKGTCHLLHHWFVKSIDWGGYPRKIWSHC